MSENDKTFTNSIGVWEIQKDGTVRLIREAEVPKERKRVKKYARSGERIRTR